MCSSEFINRISRLNILFLEKKLVYEMSVYMKKCSVLKKWENQVLITESMTVDVYNLFRKKWFFQMILKFAKKRFLQISISQKSGEKEMIHLVLQFAPAVLKVLYIPWVPVKYSRMIELPQNVQAYICHSVDLQYSVYNYIYQCLQHT